MSESYDFSPSRRRFLKIAGAAGFGAVVSPMELVAQYRYLSPVAVENPLAAYPNRDWERVYRDIFPLCQDESPLPLERFV